jgi:hypothetical protein
MIPPFRMWNKARVYKYISFLNYKATIRFIIDMYELVYEYKWGSLRNEFCSIHGFERHIIKIRYKGKI